MTKKKQFQLLQLLMFLDGCTNIRAYYYEGLCAECGGYIDMIYTDGKTFDIRCICTKGHRAKTISVAMVVLNKSKYADYARFLTDFKKYIDTKERFYFV